VSGWDLGSDVDYYEALDAPPDRHDATCRDCGDSFLAGRDGDGVLCNPCADARDAHAEALELRLAKAVA
jgi:hypothetical protein